MKDFIDKKIKPIHIAVIVLGTIFILLGAFHTTIWFDESYSIALSNNHTFSEIWTIGGHDVHPILYYWMLKIVSLIFGNNILAFRIFSVIGLVILGILGYTHIRKDFGEKTGLLFSLFTFFLPINVVYATEIRMYTWAMLFVTIMSIYAYRIYKQSSIKNWIIFAIFSLASAYTHYYGLMTAGVINIILFIYLIVQAKKQKAITKNLKSFIISAVAQIILYVPWLVFLMLQVSQVSKNFWISVKFPDTFINMFIFQFTGNLEGTIHISNICAIMFGLIMCAYIIYLILKNKKEKTAELKPAILAISIYGIVILAATIISIIMKPILYARYLLVITGLFIFFFAYVMSKIGKDKINIAVCAIVMIVSILININVIKYNYDQSNKQPIEYLKQNVQEGDLLVYGNEGSGFVVSANFPENMQYFYDQRHWNVEEAYKAYGPNMKTVYNLDDLKHYTGRIWFINASSHGIYEEAAGQYDLELIEQQSFKTVYQKYEYSFTLANKK